MDPRRVLNIIVSFDVCQSDRIADGRERELTCSRAGVVLQTSLGPSICLTCSAEDAGILVTELNSEYLNPIE